MTELNETKKTWFQIKPRLIECDYIGYCNRPVVFCNEGFDLKDVKHITSVFYVAPLLYKLTVKLYGGDEIVFDFERKAEALAAQRELQRAWTATGEFTITNNDGLDEKAIEQTYMELK